jgi:hypothetical protein
MWLRDPGLKLQKATNKIDNIALSTTGMTTHFGPGLENTVE